MYNNNPLGTSTVLEIGNKQITLGCYDSVQQKRHECFLFPNHNFHPFAKILPNPLRGYH